MADHLFEESRLATLAEVDFEALGRRLAEWLAAEGFVWELLGVRRFETPAVTDEDRELDDERRSWVFRDPAWEMTWVVVPGGECAAGYDARRLSRLKKRVAQMEPGFELEGVELEQHVAPYASGPGWDASRLQATAPSRIEPFLMPVVPLLQSTPEVGRFIHSGRRRLFNWTPGKHKVLAFHPEEIGGLLEALRARLPTSLELKWATSGGRPTLFPWGDRLPRWMWADEFWQTVDAHEEYERRFHAAFRWAYAGVEPDWARANRYGLVDALVASMWCTVDGELGYLGGAGECFPWQGCCEWANFLCAAPVRYVPTSSDPKSFQPSSHPMTPVISLTGFVG